MADIRIHRKHQLGLAKARLAAWQWAEQVEKQFDMDCTVLEGKTSDTVEFERSGVKGTLLVAADHFALDAKLGFLLGAFSKGIESEIEKSLDALLAGRAKPAAKARAAAPVPAPSAKTTVKALNQPGAKKPVGKSPTKGDRG